MTMNSGGQEYIQNISVLGREQQLWLFEFVLSSSSDFRAQFDMELAAVRRLQASAAQGESLNGDDLVKLNSLLNRLFENDPDMAVRLMHEEAERGEKE